MGSFNEAVINKALSKHFNGIERQEIDRTRYHARKLIELAAKESGLDHKGVFTSNAPTFKVMSRKAFISAVVEESESAAELSEELSSLDELVEDDEDSKMEELNNEDDELSKLNTLFENLSLYLTVPTTIFKKKRKISKKISNDSIYCDWESNSLMLFLVWLSNQKVVFTPKHLKIILNLVDALPATLTLEEFKKQFPKTLFQLLYLTNLSEKDSMILGFFVDDVKKYSDVKGEGSATKQRYLKHYMAKKNITEEINRNRCNKNKCLLVECGKKRKQENLVLAQRMLNDFSLIDGLKWLVVPSDEQLYLKFPSFWAYGLWTCLFNFYQPDFPIIPYVGGCVKRTHIKSQVTNYLYITRIIKKNGLEVDNCRKKPIYYAGKRRLDVPRHTNVTVEKTGYWSDLSLQKLHSNDGAVYPSVVVEGVLLYDNNKVDKNYFFSIFIGKDKPWQLVKWIVTLDQVTHRYEDINLSIDSGIQLNQALKRYDYPDTVPTIDWKRISIKDSDPQADHSVLSMYTVVFDIQEVCINGKLRFCNHDQATVTFISAWFDGYNPWTTSNFNISTDVGAYKIENEANHKPSVWSMRHAHTGGSIMFNAVENEILHGMTCGDVGEKYDLIKQKCVPQWCINMIAAFVGDRPQHTHTLNDCGHQGRQSQPRLIGDKDNLSYNGDSKHYNGIYPDCRIIKTKGFADACRTVLEQTPVAAKRNGFKSAAGLASDYECRYSKFQLLDSYGLIRCDPFHTVANAEGNVMEAGVGLITDGKQVQNAIWNKIYLKGTTLSPLQARSSMSCFLPGKRPNKFLNIYNAFFLCTEVTNCVSLQDRFIGHLDVNQQQRQRNVQHFLNAMRYLLSAHGRLYSNYSSSRLFQISYIQDAFLKFERALQQTKDLAVASVEEKKDQQQKGEKQNENIDALVELKKIIESSDKLKNVDKNNVLNMLKQAEKKEQKQYKSKGKKKNTNDLISYVGSILDKPNWRYTMELFLDGYFSDITMGDTAEYERLLQLAKHVFGNTDKRFAQDQFLRQLMNIESDELWRDWFANGGNDSDVLKDYEFRQYLSAPIRRGLCYCFVCT